MLLVRFLLGVAVGAAAVAASFLLTGSGDSGSDQPLSGVETTTSVVASTTTTTEARWISEGEVRFESTVLLPAAFSVESGVARLEYDLATLGPVLAGEVFQDSTLVPVQPERWLLVTAVGSFEAETSVGRSYVRFEVPDEVTIEDVTEVRLVGWRTVLPVEHFFAVPLAPGETVELPDGASLTVTSVFEQPSGTLVSFNTRRSDDGFAAGPVGEYLEPITGEGWRIAWSDDADYQIVNDFAPTAPDSVWLRYTQSMWIPVDGDVAVWQGARS